MATGKQIEANIKNAQLSTGPTSTEGRAVVSKNALKHGILSNSTLLSGEDEVLFRSFSEAIINDLNPLNDIEELYVDRIICCAWRLRRALQIENAFLEGEGDEFGGKSSADSLGGRLAEYFLSREKGLVTLSRYEVKLERSLVRTIVLLKSMRGESLAPIVSVPTYGYLVPNNSKK